MADTQWFATSRQDIAKKLKESQERVNAAMEGGGGQRYVSRFKMKPGEEKLITILVGPFFFREVEMEINGYYGNYFVYVPGGILDTQDVKPYEVYLYGILNHSSFTAKSSGKVYKDYFQWYPCKANTALQLQGLESKQGGSLVGTKWSVKRSTKKAARTGDSWYPEGKMTIEMLREKYPNAIPEEIVDEMDDDAVRAFFLSRISVTPDEEIEKKLTGEPTEPAAASQDTDGPPPIDDDIPF